MASSWNSVEIATLAVAALTPLTVAGLGYFVARTGRRIERIQWARAFRADLYVTHEARPLLDVQP